MGCLLRRPQRAGHGERAVEIGGDPSRRHQMPEAGQAGLLVGDGDEGCAEQIADGDSFGGRQPLQQPVTAAGIGGLPAVGQQEADILQTRSPDRRLRRHLETPAPIRPIATGGFEAGGILGGLLLEFGLILYLDQPGAAGAALVNDEEIRGVAGRSAIGAHILDTNRLFLDAVHRQVEKLKQRKVALQRGLEGDGRLSGPGGETAGDAAMADWYGADRHRVVPFTQACNADEIITGFIGN